jgi:uncharacterized protein YkwD
MCDHGRCDKDDLLTECPECGGEYCNRHSPPSHHSCVNSAEPVDAALYEETPSPLTKSSFVYLVLISAIVAAGYWLPVGAISEDVGEGVEAVGQSASELLSYNGTQSENGFNRTRVEQRIHHYVNGERAERGLPRIEFDIQLREIARSHSRDMAVDGYFSHQSPGGLTMEDRYERHGYDCEVLQDRSGRMRTYATGGENIAQTYWEEELVTDSGGSRYLDSNDELARSIVNQWMNSTGHRENMLERYWESEGIGVYKDGDAVYATQNFC